MLVVLVLERLLLQRSVTAQRAPLLWCINESFLPRHEITPLPRPLALAVPVTLSHAVWLVRSCVRPTGFIWLVPSRTVVTNTDNAYGMQRVEIVCAKCGGHLGHVVSLFLLPWSCVSTFPSFFFSVGFLLRVQQYRLVSPGVLWSSPS